MFTKQKEIETVIYNNKVIGFRVRRGVLYGYAEFPSNNWDLWAVTPCITKPYWQGMFENRKEAAEHLLKLDKERQQSDKKK